MTSKAAETTRVVFQAQAEGLWRALAPDMTERLKARLKEASLDMERPLPPAWPAACLHRWLDIASEELFPDMTKAEAHRRLGRRFIDGWQRTMLGAASVPLLKLLGVRRGLERLPRAFRTGDNYSEVTTTFLSDTSALVTVKSEPLEHYTAGVLDGGLAMVGARGRVTVESVSGRVMVFRLEWEA